MPITRRGPRLGAAALLSAIALAACGGSSTEAGDETTRGATTGAAIDVVNIAYAPARLEIAVGTEVTWTNQDDNVRHTVTSGAPGDNGVPGVSEGKAPKPDGTFDGDLPDASAGFSFTFEEIGTFAYFCVVHPSMVGEIVVR